MPIEHFKTLDDNNKTLRIGQKIHLPELFKQKKSRNKGEYTRHQTDIRAKIRVKNGSQRPFKSQLGGINQRLPELKGNSSLDSNLYRDTSQDHGNAQLLNPLKINSYQQRSNIESGFSNQMLKDVKIFSPQRKLSRVHEAYNDYLTQRAAD